MVGHAENSENAEHKSQQPNLAESAEQVAAGRMREDVLRGGSGGIGDQKTAGESMRSDVGHRAGAGSESGTRMPGQSEGNFLSFDEKIYSSQFGKGVDNGQNDGSRAHAATKNAGRGFDPPGTVYKGGDKSGEEEFDPPDTIYSTGDTSGEEEFDPPDTIYSTGDNSGRVYSLSENCGEKNQVIDVIAGEPFGLELKDPRDGGYEQWKLASITPKGSLGFDGEFHTSPRTQTDGDNGEQVFNFVSKGEGPVTITFSTTRPWAPDEPEYKTVTVNMKR